MIEDFLGKSRRCYLQELCNKYGNFRIAKGWKGEDGDIKWSKHRSVLECWSSDEGLRFLDTVSNRTGLEIEVRLDTDPQKGEPPEITLAKFNRICNSLEKRGIRDYAGFHSGSRGYHIHLLFRELASMNELEKKKFKAHVIETFRSEGLKASDNSMLTLEFAENNKTGQKKKLIRGIFEWLE